MSKSPKSRSTNAPLVVALTLMTAIVFQGISLSATPFIGRAAAAQCAAPAIPSLTSAVASFSAPATITLAWKPVSGNGNPVTKYQVAVLPAANASMNPKSNQVFYLPNITGSKGIVDSALSGTAAMSMKISTPVVTLGTSYVVKVSAYNGCGISSTGLFGSSNWSASSATLTPLLPASAPQNVVATPWNGSATVSWSAPASSGFGTISDYVVTATPGGTTCHSYGLLTCSFPNLTNGIAYSFTVRAITNGGPGQPSTPTVAVKPAGNPTPPQNVVATPQPSALNVSWSAPSSNGGSSIISYQVSVIGTSITCSTSGALSCVVSGLTNGTAYAIKVTAANAIGQSGPSAIVTATPATTPSAPTGVVATGATGSAIVTWSASTSSGGSAITSYTATASPGGATCTTTSATNCTIAGLTSGTSYSFSVVAHNAQGNSPAGTSATAITIGLPSLPTGIVVTPGEKSLTVQWQPSQPNGFTVTSYVVAANPDDHECVWIPANAGSGNPSCVVTGLANGTSYTITIVAQNHTGNSDTATSTAAVMPIGSPSAPTGVIATSDNTTSTVAWLAPAYVGTGSVSYKVTASPGGATCATTKLTCTVSGLTNGTAYTFVVVATNAAGSGLASTPSDAVTIGLPQPPTNVVGTAAYGQATVSWTAPAGGGPVVTYVVTATPGLYTCSTTSGTSCVVTGLTNGVAYTFTVVTQNTLGSSTPSSASVPVTPSAAPGSPTGVSATVGVGSALVSWTAPVQTGTGITQYLVTSTPDSKTCTTTGATSCTVSGLSNGTAYTFTVMAIASTLTSAPSTASTSVTTPSVPSAPAGSVSFTNVGTSSATANWGAATANGSTVLHYNVTYCGQVSGVSCSITGLSASTSYQVCVTATNAVGTGAQTCGTLRTATPAPSYFVGYVTTAGQACANERSGPSTGYGVVTCVGNGAAVNIACQIMGAAPSGSAYAIWDRLDNGNYIWDGAISNTTYLNFTPGIPRC